jgi:hypothetical protein
MSDRAVLMEQQTYNSASENLSQFSLIRRHGISRARATLTKTILSHACQPTQNFMMDNYGTLVKRCLYTQ